MRRAASCPQLPPGQHPLDQIVEAYIYVEAGKKTGNVVISLEGSR